MTLRELRMWHWQKALEASHRRHNGNYNGIQRSKANSAWKLHMGAVQLLNDFLPDTTAEQDCKQENKK